MAICGFNVTSDVKGAAMDKAQAFLKKAETDSSLQAKLAAVGWRRSAVIAIAAEAGYAITADELDAASNAYRGELSDLALDNVAGGAKPLPGRPGIVMED